MEKCNDCWMKGIIFIILFSFKFLKSDFHSRLKLKEIHKHNKPRSNISRGFPPLRNRTES